MLESPSATLEKCFEPDNSLTSGIVVVHLDAILLVEFDFAGVVGALVVPAVLSRVGVVGHDDCVQLMDFKATAAAAGTRSRK
jgi:hypothetical protein